MIYKFIYESLMARIHAQCANIQFIDLWDSQTLRPKDAQSYNTPAVFIEFRPVVWNHRANNRRVADLDIDIHIQQDVTGTDTNDTTADAARAVGLAYLEQIGAMHLALATYTDADATYGYSALTATGDRLGTNTDTQREDIISYRCHVTDDSAVPATQTVSKQMAVTVTT